MYVAKTGVSLAVLTKIPECGWCGAKEQTDIHLYMEC